MNRWLAALLAALLAGFFYFGAVLVDHQDTYRIWLVAALGLGVLLVLAWQVALWTVEDRRDDTVSDTVWASRLAVTVEVLLGDLDFDVPAEVAEAHARVLLAEYWADRARALAWMDDETRSAA